MLRAAIVQFPLFVSNGKIPLPFVWFILGVTKGLSKGKIIRKFSVFTYSSKWLQYINTIIFNTVAIYLATVPAFGRHEKSCKLKWGLQEPFSPIP